MSNQKVAAALVNVVRDSIASAMRKACLTKELRRLFINKMGEKLMDVIFDLADGESDTAN